MIRWVGNLIWHLRHQRSPSFAIGISFCQSGCHWSNTGEIFYYCAKHRALL